jgi:hypothetical protein
MTIDLNTANAYFSTGNHPEAKVWAGFTDPDTQAAAIAQAKRDIALFTKSDPDANLPDDPADPVEFPRFDYAVFEQALFILENGRQVADGAEGATKFIAGRTKPDAARERSESWISPSSIRWLFRGRVMFTRG